MLDKTPVQDAVYDYYFPYEGKECVVRLSNPVLEDEVVFEYDTQKFGTLTCEEIIGLSTKRVNIITSEVDTF